MTTSVNATAKETTDPSSAINEATPTSPNPARKLRRRWPRSSAGPVTMVVRPPSSATPMTDVRVDVETPKARSSVGRNGPTQRNAVLATTFAAVNTPS